MLFLLLPIGLCAGVLWAHSHYNGARLARMVEASLNGSMRGRWQFDSIDWPLAGAIDLRDLPVTVKNLRLHDPDGLLVMYLPEVKLHVDAWDLIGPKVLGGHRDVTLTEFDIRGGWVDVTEREDWRTPGYSSSVGFVQAFLPRRVAAAGQAAAGPGPTIDLHAARIRDVDLGLHFLLWDADLKSVSTDAWLWIGSKLPHTGMLYRVSAGHVGAARVTVPGVDIPPIELVDIDVPLFGQLPQAPDEMVWKIDRATTPAGAVLTTTGVFEMGVPPANGLSIHAELEQAGGELDRWAPGWVQTGQTRLVADLVGPIETLVLTAGVEDVGLDPGEFGLPPAHVPSAAVTWLIGDRELVLEHLEVETLGGKLSAGGHVYTGPDDVRFDVDLAVGPAIDLSAYLPAEAQRIVGGSKLSGTLRLHGTTEDLWAGPLDLALGKAQVAGSLNYTRSTGEVLPVGLRVDLPEDGATMRASGRVNLVSRTLTLGFEASVGRLDAWLRRLGQPTWVARSASGRGLLSGSFEDPRATATVSVDGVYATGRVDARIDYQGQRLVLKELRARPLGGELVGAAKLRLGPRPSIDEAFASFSRLSLAAIPGMEDVLAGTGGIELTAYGPFSQPSATLAAEFSDVAVAGEPLGELTAELRADESQLDIDRLELARPDAKVLVTGSARYSGALDLKLAAERVPLASLPWLADDQGLGVDGHVSTSLHVGGTTRVPTVDGSVTLGEIAVGQTIYGAGKLTLSSPAPGKLALVGRLFQGKISVSGEASLVAPYSASLRITFTRVEIDEAWADAGDLGVHGWASGEAEIKLGKALSVDLSISELRAEVDGMDERMRPAPVPVENVGPIQVRWDGKTAAFLAPARLRTPGGDLTMSGSASVDKLDLALTGAVELGVLQAKTNRWIDHLDGRAQMDVRVRGNAAAPQLFGSLTLTEVSIRPRGVDADIRVPLGRFFLKADRFEVEDLAVELEGHRLAVNGTVALDRFTPKSFEVEVKGRLASRLLAVAFGAQVADTSGSARLDVTAKGTFANPTIDGTLAFDSAFEISPRGLRRDLTLRAGRLVFKNRTLTVDGLQGMIDDATLGVSGQVRLDGWEFSSVDVDLAIEGISHRIPGTLEVEGNLAVNLSGDDEQLTLSGNVDVLGGRYLTQFRFTDLLRPVRVQERSVPFWAGKPLLENMKLDLAVQTSGVFVVDNGISSDMQLEMGLRVRGTPADQRLDGQIAVVPGGHVKIPAFRPTFEVASGSVTFSPYEKIENGTRVDIRATAQYTDREERPHNITLTLRGPLSRLEVDLSTLEGLNSAQTFFLISTGATTDDRRRQARGDVDTGVARDDAQATTSVSVGDGGTFSIADRLVKDVAGDFLSTMIEQPLRNQFPILDCARFELGTESSQVSLCSKLSRFATLGMEYEYGYQGRTRLRLSLGSQINDRWSVSGMYQQKDVAENEDPENRSDWSLQLRFKWSIH